MGIHDLVQLTTGRVYAEFLTSEVAEIWGEVVDGGFLLGCFGHMQSNIKSVEFVWFCTWLVSVFFISTV